MSDSMFSLYPILVHSISSLGFFLAIYVYFKKLEDDGRVIFVDLGEQFNTGVRSKKPYSFFRIKLIPMGIPVFVMVWLHTLVLLVFGDFFGIENISGQIKFLWALSFFGVFLGVLGVLAGLFTLVFFTGKAPKSVKVNG